MTIGTIEIYAAFRALLEANFSEILTQIKDIKNPKPPCFYIQYTGKSTNQRAQSYKNELYAWNILYFAGENELLELLEIEEQLERLLEKPLKCEKDGEILFVELGQLDFSRNEDDYILTCGVNIDLTQAFKADEYETDEVAGLTNADGTPVHKDENAQRVITDRYGEKINTEIMEEIEL